MKFYLAVVLFFLLLPAALIAQNKDGAIHVPDTMNYAYIKIAGVEITGNKLTKPFILTRELEFKVGDSLATFQKGKRASLSDRHFYPGDSSDVRISMNRSRENLINTNLFLTVDMFLVQTEGNNYTLRIAVNERHYWWLFPVAKLNAPNFNEWLRDIDWTALSMGAFFSHNNLFGLGHQTSLVAYFGKSWAIAWGYKIPWLNKTSRVGLLAGAAYQNLYTVEYASKENKRQMLYAPNSSQNVKVTAKLTWRPSFYNYATVKVTGEWIKVSDSLYSLDSNYLAGNKTTNTSISLYLDYAYDSRNSKSYPLKGNMLRGFVNKMGLGLISKDVNLFYYGVDFHFYQAIGKRWYVAEMFKAENSAGENAPYYYQLNMTQGKDFIRGFDLYTLKGDQMYFTRNNIKFELVKPHLKKAKEGQEKNKFKNLQYAFYLNGFADAGYVVNKFTDDNPYNNKLVMSTGLGIDFVTYYDLVIRFEYAFTSIGTNGFFFGFGMPI